MTQESQPASVAPKQFVRRGIMICTVARGDSEPTCTGQLWASYGDEEPTMQQAVGVGPIDVWFKCVQAHVAARGLFPQGLRFNGNGDHFVILSRGNGATAPAWVRVRLCHGECYADGEGTHVNTDIACADAVCAATTKLLQDQFSGAIPLPNSEVAAASAA